MTQGNGSATGVAHARGLTKMTPSEAFVEQLAAEGVNHGSRHCGFGLHGRAGSFPGCWNTLSAGCSRAERRSHGGRDTRASRDARRP